MATMIMMMLIMTKMLSDRNRMLPPLLIPESSAGINTTNRLDRGSPTPPVHNHPSQALLKYEVIGNNHKPESNQCHNEMFEKINLAAKFVQSGNL